MPFQDLQKKCNEIFESISISQDEALNIESQTRSQSKSQKWYGLRAVRTTSVMKEACRTNSDIPSLSLIKKKIIELNSEVLQQTGELNTKTHVIFQFLQALMRI